MNNGIPVRKFFPAVIALHKLPGLLWLGLMFVVPAVYGQNEDNNSRLEEIVVTGTHIRSEAPVGSAVIALSHDEMMRTGVTNTADLLDKIPQVLQIGTGEDVDAGALFQGSDLNTMAINSINLRGLGTAATLNLIDSHRIPPQGPNLRQFDSNSIPLIALERIEVVADGASAIYGSDAIAGVVNYIIRKPFDGAETSVNYGTASDAQRYQVSQVFSQKWDTGGFLIAGQFSHHDKLRAADRPSLYNDDFSAYGGSPSSNFAAPGNVVIGGTSYAIPSGNATDLQLSDLGAAGTVNRQNQWKYRDATPDTDHYSIILNGEQQLTDKIKFHAEGMWTRREIAIVQEPSVATLTVPDTNPYSPCNASHAPFTNLQGITCTGSLTVQYSLAQELPNLRKGAGKMWYALGGFKFSLPYQWNGDISYEHGESSNQVTNYNQLAGRGALLATAVSMPPAGVPYFNPFCDGTAGCNAQATLDFVSGYQTTSFDLNREHVVASLNGPVFSLPGGDVKLAVGGEYLVDDYVNINRSGQAGGSVREFKNVTPTRKVKTGYAELYIPLIGDNNAMPGVKKLELDAAVRYEDYSDFGTTTNPKIGINYMPVDNVKFHGTYGTSFRAPSLADINPDSTAALLPRTIAGSDITNSGYLGGAGTQFFTAVVGGNSEINPEKGETWTLGLDLSHVWKENKFNGSLNYYNIKYTDQIGFPAYNTGGQAVNLPQYSPYIILNPTFFSNSQYTQAEYDAISAALVSGGVPPSYSPYEQGNRLPIFDPTNGAFILDGRRHNASIVNTDGLDFSLNVNRPTNFGSLRGGVAGTYVLSYKTADVPGSPMVQKVNYFGNPIQFRLRGNVGIDYKAWSATAFVNYANSYKIERRFIPAAAPDKYLKIGSHTTVDLSITYDTGDHAPWELLNGLLMNLSVQNLFDADPPKVLNIQTFPVMYDPNNTNPYGRLVTFQMTKKW